MRFLSFFIFLVGFVGAANAESLSEAPPAGYFELIGLLGSIVTGVPVAAINSGATECQRQALAAAYEMSGFELAGVRFECAIFTHEGGGMTMSIHRIGR